MEEIGRRGKWKRKATVGILLLLCNFSLASSQSLEEQQCPEGDYLTDDGICCNKCSPGYKLKTVCQAEGHRSDCVRCPTGQYTDQMNYGPNCMGCKRCKKFEEVKKPCEGNHDTICSCKDGYYKDVINSVTHQCLRCTECGTGERQTDKCTPEHNTVCECEKNYYKSKNKCLPCKNCTAGCELHCTPTLEIATPPKNETFPVNVVLIGVGLLVVSLLLIVFITYKATKQYTSNRLPGPSPSPDAFPDTTTVLIHSEEASENNCNRAVPVNPVSDQEPPNLPDCIPLEINIPDLIYTVLDLVPVLQVKQLARSLGLTDIEIERAEADHRACQEAHYQMLRVWAERGSRVGGGGGGGRQGGVLHRPLMRELMDKLRKMHLGGAVEELETKYGIQ